TYGPTRQQGGGRRPRPYGPHGRRRGVTRRHSTDESFEQRQKTVGGERGGKAVDQGECVPTTPVPDTEREGRGPGAGGRAERSTGKQGDEVHRSSPPPDRRSAAGKLLLPGEESRTRSGRGHLAGV